MAGVGAEYAQGAREGLWHMRHDPGVAFLCGPMALLSLVRWQQDHHQPQALPPQQATQAAARLLAYRSPPQGVHLATLTALADEVGLGLRAVHRQVGAAMPTGAVVHWRVNHYAAIVEQHDGRFHLIDPTFDSADLWVTQETLEQESSGYFLVPSAMATTKGFTPVTQEQARDVYGMGWTQNDRPDPPEDPGDCQPRQGHGMAICTASEYNVKLTLRDTPLTHKAILGPPSQVTITYKQRTPPHVLQPILKRRGILP